MTNQSDGEETMTPPDFSRRVLIGLAGRAGVGKDFTFGQLLERDPERFTRLALADGVRFEVEMALTSRSLRSMEFFGAQIDELWRKPYPLEIRRLLQWWGTDLRRAESEDYWLWFLEERLSWRFPPTDFLVITDVRFPNEAEWVRSKGGLVVQLVCHHDIRRSRLGGTLPPEHASESSVDLIRADLQVETGDPARYQQGVKDIFDSAERLLAQKRAAAAQKRT